MSNFTIPVGPLHVALEEPMYFRIDVRGELAGILAISLKGKRPAAGAGRSQVEMVAGTGIDHNLQSTPVKMVAGGCNHHYLRPTNIHFPINAKSNARRMVAKNSSFHSVLFRTAA